MMTYSVRATQKGSQRSKLHGYQSIGIKAAKIRAQSRKPIDETSRLAVDHRLNSYEAFMHADEKE